MSLNKNQQTIKNAWKSDIIEKLSKITTNITKTNFSDATETLEDSIKLYTTRVDNVSIETNKLIETVNHETHQKKEKRKKRKIQYLEKDVQIPVAPFFEYKKKLDILSKHLKNNNLLIEIYSGYGRKGINLFNNESILLESETKYNYEEYNFTNFITPSVQKEDFDFLTKSREKIDSIDLEIENEIAIEREQEFFEESSKDEDVEVNPFVYLGWGGPRFWKMKQRKILHKRNKKEKTKIDLKQKLDFKLCFEKGNIFFSREVINERKKTEYYLVEDELHTGLDLLSFIYYPGFYTNKVFKKSHDRKENTFAFLEDKDDFENEENQKILPNEIDDFEVELNNNEMGEEQKALTQILMSKYSKVPKKIDMHKLKENVYSSLGATVGSSCNLKNILDCLDTKYNSTDRKDISVHYCFISLLHLVNERGISLESDGKNIQIKI
ncbi:Condensin complex subunit 2 [Cucumispora dikerogammari]|nr:Condensin complex subunit 2 [Cucumispora dikerogammari]